MMCFLLLWAVTFITFPYVTAGSAGRPLYAIWVFVLFFSLSAHFVVVPGTCTRIFSPLHMATIYGLVYFATVSSFFHSPTCLATNSPHVGKSRDEPSVRKIIWYCGHLQSGIKIWV
ncbi:hypothetical protein ECG_05216 [Echinococcus granulosus]|uniref:Oxalate:formate antiporter n=1 Tax=Echinococcus granulosus TaxID=6210 RepID=A0A068WDE7_ECHGR|nr:hypothetical protein ECG_05216 [Echinococcus granulosus]CDS18117.1 oxalate:formate antiporter [Echinococcus granulosus]